MFGVKQQLCQKRVAPLATWGPQFSMISEAHAWWRVIRRDACPHTTFLHTVKPKQANPLAVSLTETFPAFRSRIPYRDHSSTIGNRKLERLELSARLAPQTRPRSAVFAAFPPTPCLLHLRRLPGGSLRGEATFQAYGQHLFRLNFAGSRRLRWTE